MARVFDLPTSDCNYFVYKFNNPFVEVLEVEPRSERILDGDKLRDGKKMDPDALSTATDIMTKSAGKTSMSFEEASTGPIIHGSLLLDLWLLTKPGSLAKVQLQEIPLEPNIPEYNPANIQGDDLLDLDIVAGQDSEPIGIQHEGDDPEAAQPAVTEETGYHFRIRVRDQKAASGLTDENWVTVMLVECSLDAISKNMIYQASASVSKKDAFFNMAKGRYEPIFLEAWGQAQWMYGMLRPLGIIRVQGGQVVGVNSKKPNGMRYFQTRLDATTNEVRSQYKDFIQYEDGDYLHGALFVSRKRWVLPDLNVEENGLAEHSKLFFQTLLRVVDGKRKT